MNLPARIKNISGQKFGMLTARHYVGLLPPRGAVWMFDCDCGNERPIAQVTVTRILKPMLHCGCQTVPRKGPRPARTENASIRVQKGLTQKQAAIKVGCDQSYLSRVEGGKVKPSAELIAMFQDIYGGELDL